MISRLIALVSVILALGFAVACDEGQPTPTPSINSAPTGMEIFVDEDATVMPDLEPGDRLSVRMVPETRANGDPLARCLDMGGVLTLDMICHDVDH